MSNINDLREILETVHNTGSDVKNELIENLEKSADILIELLKKKLEECGPENDFFDGVKQIVISFQTISEDFTKFDGIKVKCYNEDCFIEKEIKYEGIYKSHYELEPFIKNAKIRILSGLNMDKHKEQLIKFNEVLVSKGFVCFVDITNAMFGRDDINKSELCVAITM